MNKCLIGLMIFGLVMTSVVNAQINVPDKIDEHKPITASSETEADVYIWHVPRGIGKITVDGGKGLHLWAPPGEYELELTTITVDVKIDPNWKPDSGTPPTINKDIQYNEHYALFEVIGDKKPDVIIPDDDPDVDPDPDVKPNAFKQKIATALKSVDSAGTTYKGAVASIYSNIAQEAEAQPNSWDAASMVNEAKVRVAGALPTDALRGWSGFWPKMGKAFTELGLSSDDLNGHIKAFNEFVEVLEK